MKTHLKLGVIISVCVLIITGCAKTPLESYQNKISELKIVEELDTQQEALNTILRDFEQLASDIKKSISSNTDINHFINQVEQMGFNTIRENASNLKITLSELEAKINGIEITDEQVNELNQQLLSTFDLYDTSLDNIVQMVNVSEEGLGILSDLFNCYLELNQIALDNLQLSKEYDKASNDVFTNNESLFTELSQVDYTLALDSENFNAERLELINTEIDSLIEGFKSITTYTEDDEKYNTLKIKQYELINAYIDFSISNHAEMIKLFNLIYFTKEIDQANEAIDDWKKQVIEQE